MKKFIITIFIIFCSLAFPLNSQAVFAEENNLDNYNDPKYTNFNILSQDNFYVLNSQTNQIEHYFKGEISSFGSFGEEETLGQFTTVLKMIVLKNGEIAVFDNLKKLHFFDSNYNHIKTIKTIKQNINNNTSFKTIEKISDIKSDIYSNVYLIDYINGYILKANSSSSNFEVIKEISVSENSKLTILNNSNEIALVDETKLYINNQDISLSSQAKEIFTDAKNYIFIAFENKISKYANTDLKDEIQIENANYFSIDQETGKIFFWQNGKINSISDFASNIQNLPAPVDDKQKIALKSVVEIFKCNQTTALLKTPYSYDPIITIAENDKVVVLSKSQDIAINYYYVMLEKNACTYLGYVQKKFLSEEISQTLNLKTVPVRKNIQCFKYPNQNQDYKLFTLDITKTYNTISQITLNSETFYAISFENSIVYANINDLIEQDYYNSISVYLITNATISPYNNEIVTIYEDENKTNAILTKTNKCNVKLISSKNGMSEIEILENNTILHGFVETKFIVNQNDYAIPLTIIISLICIIMLTVIIFKFKKDRSKKFNN